MPKDKKISAPGTNPAPKAQNAPSAQQERFAQLLAHGVPVIEAAKDVGIQFSQGSRVEGFGVYFLSDPRDGVVFYVGKGKRRRPWDHEKECRRGQIRNTCKYNAIRDILRAGFRPVIHIVADNLIERKAQSLEMFFIRAIGRSRLTNWNTGSSAVVGSFNTFNVADGLLRRVKSFGSWLRETPRSRAEIDIFLFVVRGLRKSRDISRASIGLSAYGT